MTTLDELRRANLQEQRRAAERAAARQAAAAAANAAAPAETVPASVPGQTEPALPRNGASASTEAEPTPAPVLPELTAETLPAAVPVAETAESAPVAAAVVEKAEPEPVAEASAVTPALQPAAPAAPEISLPAAPAAIAAEPAPAPAAALAPAAETDEAASDEDFVVLVRDRLSKRVIYRTGVKATVDMPPELFWRLKRYCHDHNNLTVRQAFLDLMIAFLEHEGY